MAPLVNTFQHPCMHILHLFLLSYHVRFVPISNIHNHTHRRRPAINRQNQIGMYHLVTKWIRTIFVRHQLTNRVHQSMCRWICNGQHSECKRRRMITWREHTRHSTVSSRRTCRWLHVRITICTKALWKIRNCLLLNGKLMRRMWVNGVLINAKLFWLLN